MKKLFAFLLIISSLLLGGCNKVYEIENNRIITACIAIKDEDTVKYGFYVSIPTGSDGGEDSGSKSSSKIYEYVAKNFSHALSLFEDSGTEKTDISHISLFAANKAYYDDCFKADEKYIRDKIPAIPLVYTCMIDDNYEDLIECINNEYRSIAEDFSKNIFNSSSTKFNCMMSELSLSVCNKNYTASIPVLNIHKRGEGIMPEITSVAFYSHDSDIAILNKNEFDIYGKWIKKYEEESRGYKLTASKDKLIVKTKEMNICKLADKYIENGIDILNTKYYSKKCFLTYESYDNFIRELNKTNNIFFEAEI